MDFLREAYQHRWETQGRKFSVNVGSWWPYIFDQTRLALASVKNARTWQIPTAFGPRSTLSGIGSVVHPGNDWISERETKKLWQRQADLFDFGFTDPIHCCNNVLALGINHASRQLHHRFRFL